jgi:hypothetical protein
MLPLNWLDPRYNSLRFLRFSKAVMMHIYKVTILVILSKQHQLNYYVLIADLNYEEHHWFHMIRNLLLQEKPIHQETLKYYPQWNS